jgi:alpha-L-fucosidase
MTDPALSDRPLPRWYDEAGFGIFIHWGPYSVPAWAPTGGREWEEILKDRSALERMSDDDWLKLMSRLPYADWYWNTLAIDGSPTHQHHLETYGDQPYEVFGEQFADGLESPNAAWDPNDWADLFARAGAKYVVLNTKDADGFALYPSEHKNPFIKRWQLERDIVGELAAACRARGLRFGAFFTAGLDWTFTPPPVINVVQLSRYMPDSDDYHRFVSLRIREVIDRYKPDVLWDDMGWPPSLPHEEVFRYYYERVPDGVINDRFDRQGVIAGTAHADFTTPEYRTEPEVPNKKWEMCRGMGNSFGYNAAEGPEWHLTTQQVVKLLNDVNSRGGNLLLNTGPTADGAIPPIQRQVLEGLAEARAKGDSRPNGA